MPNAITSAVNAGNNAVTANDAATPGGAAGLLNQNKDAKEAQTAAQFGEVLKKMQAQYGGKPDKPREIKKTLGKDDFLKIMVTQMRHQDPTNPFKAEQMATEMAQFTSVEQLQNMNQSMTKLMAANQPLERMATTNLIGKVVTVDRDRFVHTENEASIVKYALPRDAKEVKAVVVSEQGEVVMEKDLGALKAGGGEFAWDGIKKNTLPAKTGNYIFRLEARDDKGNLIQTETKRKARVVGVAFEGNEAILLVGDNRVQEKVGLKSIIRIEDASGFPAALPGAPGAASTATGAGGIDANASAPNFFSFKKGEGSGNLDAAQMTPEVQAALAQFMGGGAGAAKAPTEDAEAKAAAAKAAEKAAEQKKSEAVAASKPTGFPNGIGDNGDVDTSDISAKLAQAQPGATSRTQPTTQSRPNLNGMAMGR